MEMYTEKNRERVPIVAVYSNNWLDSIFNKSERKISSFCLIYCIYSFNACHKHALSDTTARFEPRGGLIERITNWIWHSFFFFCFSLSNFVVVVVPSVVNCILNYYSTRFPHLIRPILFDFFLLLYGWLLMLPPLQLILLLLLLILQFNA